MTTGTYLDQSPWSGFQVRTWLLIAATILFDGIDQNLLAVTVPVLSRSWHVEASHFATITALATVAMLVGSAIAGVCSDRIGRRWTLIGSSFVYALAGFGAALAWDLTTMGAARIVAGVGLGAALTTAVVSIAEHTPTRKRGIVIASSMLGVPIGGILAGLLGAALIVPHGWQAVYLAGGVLPLLLAAAYLVLLPETPVYLRLKQGDGLARYFVKMGVPMPEELGTDAAAVRQPRGNPLALLAPGLRRDTLLLWAGFFSSLLISYHVINWLPALMSHAGASVTLSSASLSYLSIGSLVGGVAASVLVLFLGSRISMVGGAAASMAVGLWLAISFDGNPTGPATIAVLPTLLIGVAIINTLFYTILPNVYPENVRGVGIGFGMAVGRLGAVASAFVGAWGLGGGGLRFFGVVVAAGLVALVSFALIDKHQPRAR